MERGFYDRIAPYHFASRVHHCLRFEILIPSKISNHELFNRLRGKASTLPILLIITTTYLDPFHESLRIGILELLLTADSVYGDSGSGYNLEYLLS